MPKQIPQLLNLENLKEFWMGPEIVIDNVPLWKLEYYDGHVFKNAFEINKNLIDNPISIAQIKS